MSSLEQGIQIIKDHIMQMPHAPGVYRMLGENGEILYIGKAKDLPKRVVSYTRTDALPYRLQFMVSLTRSMAFMTTETESEALLLEANLIKKLEPRFNILLRDDKSYPYILLTSAHDYPRITKHRGVQKQKGTYFGPFISATAVNQAIADLQKAFLLRPCTDSFFAKRTRPCMEYQIKRCSAPCVDKISPHDYQRLFQQAKECLRGHSRQVQEELQQQMFNASEAMDYEKARELRDRIRALNLVQSKQSVQINNLPEADVIAMVSSNQQYCVEVLFIRNHQLLGSKAYYPAREEDGSMAEVLCEFLMQYYQRHPVPKSLLLNVEVDEQALLEKVLSELSNHAVSITIPQKSAKKRLMDNAVRNAENSLRNYLAKKLKQHTLLDGVKELFDLPKQPERIEIYDNSHIQGRHEIGAMVVAGKDGFIKSAYRKFNIKTTEAYRKGDDYAMMREVMQRRFRHYAKRHEAEPQAWPDLLLIDGGAGHLSTVADVFKELAVEIPYVCIAKGVDRNAGREWFHMSDREPFQLPVNDPVLHYLQILRDEAHHFAIGSHRKKRKANTLRSALDDVPGIGSTRKKALLLHFGSAQAVKTASVTELTAVHGVSRSTAQQIYDYFRS